MICDPHRQRQAKSNFHSRPPWPEIASRYPSITAADGRVYFVDEDGLIDGMRHGRRRCDFPSSPPKAIDVLAVMRWIEERSITGRKAGSVCSYAAKHAAERFTGRHISNGAAIIAFDRCGFRQHVSVYGFGELNTQIGIALKSYKGLPEASGWQKAVMR